ncbi:hypothetical protein ACXWSA_09465, partial [Streptococcus pyogenes]
PFFPSFSPFSFSSSFFFPLLSPSSPLFSSLSSLPLPPFPPPPSLLFFPFFSLPFSSSSFFSSPSLPFLLLSPPSLPSSFSPSLLSFPS